MAYIEVHQALHSHRKTLRLCRLLQMDRFCVVGRLVALWSWALDNAPEGWVSASDADLLADVMGWDGEPAALCEALVSAGFLDLASVDDKGAYVLHDWMDYAGRLMEQRRSNAKRQQAWRDRNKTPAASDDARNGDVTGTSALRNGALYLTIPDQTVPSPSDNGEVSEKSKDEIFVAAEAAPPDSANASPAMIGAPTPDEKPPSQHKPVSPKQVFAEDSPPMQLAQYLAAGIRSHKPDAKIPRDLQVWAREFDLMLRVDKRPRDAITAVIDFATTNTFWRRVIFSADKLRQKFDTLDCQANEHRQEERSNGPVSGNRRDHASGGWASGKPEVGTPEYYAAAGRRMAERATEAEGKRAELAKFRAGLGTAVVGTGDAGPIVGSG